MKIGILTSGGDCPGLNAVIRGAVLKGITVHGHEFVGFLDGWRGVVEGDVAAVGDDAVDERELARLQREPAVTLVQQFFGRLGMGGDVVGALLEPAGKLAVQGLQAVAKCLDRLRRIAIFGSSRRGICRSARTPAKQIIAVRT